MLPDRGVVMGPSVVVIVGVHEQSSFGNGPTIVVPTILTFTLSSNWKDIKDLNEIWKDLKDNSPDNASLLLPQGY